MGGKKKTYRDVRFFHGAIKLLTVAKFLLRITKNLQRLLTSINNEWASRV